VHPCARARALIASIVAVLAALTFMPAGVASAETPTRDAARVAPAWHTIPKAGVNGEAQAELGPEDISADDAAYGPAYGPVPDDPAPGDAEPEPEIEQTPATKRIAGPKVSAEAAILVDAQTGAVLWARDQSERRAPASLTKMLTALTVRASLPMNSRLTISKKAAAVVPTKVGLPAGRHVTVEQALAALMVISANDMAITLAEAAGKKTPKSPVKGAEVRFLKALDAQSARLGMKDSSWKTPNGLDASGHRSTAFDLAIAARAVLRDASLAKTVRRKDTVSVITPDGIRVFLRPRSAFLRTYPGAVGVKTGYTNDAGHCLAAAATRNGRTLIAVVLDSPSPNLAASTMMNWGFGPGAEQRTGSRLPSYVAPASVEKLLAQPNLSTPPPPEIDPGADPERDTSLAAAAIAPTPLERAISPQIMLPSVASVATGCSALLLLARRRRRASLAAASTGPDVRPDPTGRSSGRSGRSGAHTARAAQGRVTTGEYSWADLDSGQRQSWSDPRQHGAEPYGAEPYGAVGLGASQFRAAQPNRPWHDPGTYGSTGDYVMPAPETGSYAAATPGGAWPGADHGWIDAAWGQRGAETGVQGQPSPDEPGWGQGASGAPAQGLSRSARYGHDRNGGGNGGGRRGGRHSSGRSASRRPR
jgi:D-alanyl-D-alanine carboxypeptidase